MNLVAIIFLIIYFLFFIKFLSIIIYDIYIVLRKKDEFNLNEYMCEKCNKKFNKKTDLDEHILNCCNNNSKIIYEKDKEIFEMKLMCKEKEIEYLKETINHLKK